MRCKLLVLGFLSIFYYNNLSAQVGIGTSGDPDESSILEIQSSSKGVLIPRMNTSSREGISSPAQGLLVFDTNTNSFWYFNSSWVELVSEKTLVDTDGDTKVQVQRTNGPDDDKIHLTTRGVDRMRINPDGVMIFGDSIASTDNTGEFNYTKIAADGSLSYEGNATRWDDLKIPVNAVKKKEGDTDPATFDVLVDGLAALKFKNDKDRSVFFTVQMPHGWKEGSNIFPHVHWSVQSNIANPDTQGVVWGLEYRWASVGQKFNDDSTSPLTLVTGQAVAAPNLINGVEAYEHVITPLKIHSVDGVLPNGVDATGKTLSSMLICRLFRDVSDTYNGNDVFLLEIDFHYQIDSDGSNQEYIKK